MGQHTHGTTIGYGTTTPTVTIGRLMSFNTSGMTRDSIDTSSCDSVEKFRTFIPGMIDAGEISGTIRFAKAELAEVQTALTDTKKNWTLTFPDGSTFACQGFMTAGLNVTGEYQGDMTSDFTVKLCKKPTITPAA